MTCRPSHLGAGVLTVPDNRDYPAQPSAGNHLVIVSEGCAIVEDVDDVESARRIGANFYLRFFRFFLRAAFWRLRVFLTFLLGRILGSGACSGPKPSRLSTARSAACCSSLQ